jgi:acetyltransferase-like isoleucine patch superfamily enzyme
MSLGERWGRVVVARKRLVIWGASDQCRVNYQILKQLKCHIEALIDDTPGMSSPFAGVPIYLGESGLDAFLQASKNRGLGFVLAIGNPFGHVRMELHHLLKTKGLFPVSFADPTALICKTAVYGEGLQVMPAAIVHNDVRIGDQCIVNTRALVEHDCVLKDGVEIGSNSIVGAGSVVVSDIPSNVIAVGVPAKVIRENVKHE